MDLVTFTGEVFNGKPHFFVQWYYCLELLFPETMKLLGSTENKITKDKNG